MRSDGPSVRLSVCHQVSQMKVVFFRSASEMRRWFATNHASCQELWIGFYNKQSGRGGVTYREALDMALCYGWIDGVRRKVDEASYTSRFTPRKARSNWSAVNIRRVRELIEMGHMQPPGLEAFERRDEKAARQYSYERENANLPPDLAKVFRRHRAAWRFFQAQPPSYRRVATWWVISAKREETRARRLAMLIEESAREERLSMLHPGRRRSTRPRREKK